MTYVVLARKYRPRSFAQMVGQAEKLTAKVFRAQLELLEPESPDVAFARKYQALRGTFLLLVRDRFDDLALHYYLRGARAWSRYCARTSLTA